MSDQAIGDHLICLVIDGFAHFGSCSVSRDLDWRNVSVLKIGAVVNQMGFAIVAVMTRECLRMINLQQLFESSLIGQG